MNINRTGANSLTAKDIMEMNRTGFNSLTAKDIMEMATGFQKSQVLYAATSLGVFDELNSCSTSMSATKLAFRLGLHPDSTERLLNACVAMALVIKTFDMSGVALYRNSLSTDKFLAKSSPTSLKPLIVLVGDDIYSVFGQLKNGVKQGMSQLDVALHNGDRCFDTGTGFYSTTMKQFEFLHSMHMLSKMDAEHVIKAFDLREFCTACDVGGGTGALGSSLALAYPEMSVKVIDLEHVISVVHHFLPNPKPSNLHFEPKDFFKDELPKSDLFVLSHVVHNWDDEHLDILLKRVYESLSPGGAILVLEKVLNEAKDGPLNTLIFDLAMLISADGRERTAGEYRNLLEGHGFVDVQVRLLAESSRRDAILARKPQCYSK